MITASCGNLQADIYADGAETEIQKNEEFQYDDVDDLKKIFANSDEIILKIRDGLKGHSRKITISFEFEKDILDGLKILSGMWYDEAVKETGAADEGDYIRYQCGGYESKCRYEKHEGTYSYLVEIIPKYYMYLAQEEEVSDKIDEIIGELDITEDLPDIEKAEAIYGYICKNVIYDRSHRKRKLYSLRSTSWAALVKGSATCQGYAVTLYRMLKECGIDSRVIIGRTDEDGLHAWNIIGIDGKYYLADATWDAENEDYSFFLKGSNNFKDHVADDEFLTKEFTDRYKIEDEDYPL